MNLFKSSLNKMLPQSVIVQLRALDYRIHSGEEWRLLPRLCARNKCSVDVGANLGVLTYFLARYSSHVYAYEPNPELAAKLRSAFRKKVTVVQTALSDASGSTILKIPLYGGKEMHGLASIVQDFREADAVREFPVETRRLDDEGLQGVGFVKIDVEQNEERVLRGAMRLFATQKPNILLEVSPKRYSKSLAEFLANILELGYKGYFFFDGSLRKLEDYRVAIHNHSDNYGVPAKYVTNVVLSMYPLF